MKSDRPLDSPPSYDLLAIGCGPFNLGLAALASTLTNFAFVALERASEIRWHPGLMFEDARLQVSFLADLVTLVDPTHSCSFLAYLRDEGRIYSFYVRETFHLTRREYELYLRWVARRLHSLRFGQCVESVSWNAPKQCFEVRARSGEAAQTLNAKHIAVGIGTAGAVPASLNQLPTHCLLHSGSYLNRVEDVTRAGRVCVVGSGQSGAEIVLDLLRRDSAHRMRLCWFTRAAGFAPLDYTKLVLEMTTPDYVRYFHGLPESKRAELLKRQWQHYKGISSETLTEIYELLYRRSLDVEAAPVDLRCACEVESSRRTEQAVELTCRHADTGQLFQHETDIVIAATGYRHRAPDFLEPVSQYLRREESGLPKVRLDHSLEADPHLQGRIFVANADLHSHGVAAPDLGIAAVRNATILNVVSGREVYALPSRTAFTSFAPPALGAK